MEKKILFKVRAELLLGQPSKLTYCNHYTLLLDEISKLSSQYKVLVISCLSSIIAKLGSSADAKKGIEKAMKVLTAAFHDVTHQSQGQTKILVAQCTPRKSQDFTVHNKFAMVTTMLC
jgi:hypothetical protein